jgi:hypothetical protein
MNSHDLFPIQLRLKFLTPQNRRNQLCLAIQHLGPNRSLNPDLGIHIMLQLFTQRLIPDILTQHINVLLNLLNVVGQSDAQDPLEQASLAKGLGEEEIEDSAEHGHGVTEAEDVFEDRVGEETVDSLGLGE